MTEMPTISGAKKRPDLDPPVIYGLEEDERDARSPSENLWKVGGEEKPPLHIFQIHSPKRGEFHNITAFVEALARLSNDKPRWQKITEHAESLANDSDMTLEEFYSTALIEFIEKSENERINRELTKAYANIDQEEDLSFVNKVVRNYDPRLADQ